MWINHHRLFSMIARVEQGLLVLNGLLLLCVTVAYSFGVPVYSLSFAAALVNFKAAITVTILLALFFAIPAELMFPERK